MYVDESGTSHYKDASKYFILSGVVVSENNISKLQRATFEYKSKYFVGDYIDSEIHTHDIHRSKNDFANLNLVKIQELLDNLYAMINTLDITIISVVINKELWEPKTRDWYVLDIAWKYLIERFDKFVDDNFDTWIKRNIKIDKSSKIIQRDTLNIINNLRRSGTGPQQKIRVDNSIFVDSSGIAGIQIADAVAHCSLMHAHNNNKRHKGYWDLIYPKFWQNPNGSIDDYGWKEYPK